MPSPRSGNAPQVVLPAAPKQAFEADKADPGEMDKIKAEQKHSKTGKYGEPAIAKPRRPPQTQVERQQKNSWIGVILVGEDGKPIPGEKYRITLPDDSVAEGTLDENGRARVDGIEPGTCRITFPDLDREAWEAC